MSTTKNSSESFASEKLTASKSIPLFPFSRKKKVTPLIDPDVKRQENFKVQVENFHDIKNEKGEAAPNQPSLNADSACALMVSSIEPNLANLDQLPFRNAGYVRFKQQLPESADLVRNAYNQVLRASEDKIYYVNKRTRECIALNKVNKRTLLQFDEAFNLSNPFKQSGLNAYQDYRLLSEKELNKIMLLTGHSYRPMRATPPASSAWQSKNGCDLIVSTIRPTRENLDNFPITSAAYIRYQDKLYYVNKKSRDIPFLKMSKIRTFKMTPERLARFDHELKTSDAQHRKLNDKELTKIKEVTGHSHRTAWQKFLSGFGLACSAVIAVGSGVSTAGTFISMNIATGGIAGAIAALLFIAGTAVNWWIFRRYVPPVLIDLFGREKFMVDEDGKPLPTKKKIFMGIAVALAASVGITFAALTFSSTFDLVLAFPFLAAIGPALPYIAAVLAGVTLICMTAMMLKDIADLIKKKDVVKEVKGFLKTLFGADPDLPQNKGKSLTRIKWERNFRVALTFIFLPLACIGLFMTMNACAPGVKAILLKHIPIISAKIADGIAKVISLGLAFIGQIPFGIQTAFQTLFSISNALFNPKKKGAVVPGQKPATTASKVWDGIKLANVAVNAIGNGGISAKGAGKASIPLAVLSLISGTANSAFAGTPAVLTKKGLLKPLTLPVKDDLYLNTRPARADLIAPHSDRPLRPLTFSDKLNQNLRNSTGMFAPEAKLEAKYEAKEVRLEVKEEKAPENVALEVKEEKARPHQPRLFSADDMVLQMSKSRLQNNSAPARPRAFEC